MAHNSYDSVPLCTTASAAANTCCQQRAPRKIYKSRSAIHINFIWRSLQDVMYKRLVDANAMRGDDRHWWFPEALFVTGGLQGDVEVPCTHLIATTGAAAMLGLGPHGTSIEACDAYLRKGCCQRGYECPYAHLIVLGDAAGEAVQGRFRASQYGYRAKQQVTPIPTPQVSPSDASLGGLLPSQEPPGVLELTSFRPPPAAAALELSPTPSVAPPNPSGWWYRNPYTGTRVPCKPCSNNKNDDTK